MSSAQVAVSGEPFAETLAFFTDELGFRLDLIAPADDPAIAVVSHNGMTLRIDRDAPDARPRLRIEGDRVGRAQAPNGMVVELVEPSRLAVPDLVPELVITRMADAGSWGIGRAGMRYRDLLPSRLGGRFIASHIEVCDGGPVPDMVHHHAIRFQMIFCHRGWVDVVYQDQGPPFRLHAGDCVLQPPHIRHRVLESSAGAQVVEIGCPAEHDTLFDHELDLPTDELRPDRDFGGQRFVRHVAADSPWTPWRHEGFSFQETAIGEATDGLAGVRVIRADGGNGWGPDTHAGELYLAFVREGAATLSLDGSRVEPGDCLVVPAGTEWALSDASPELSFLEVTLPA